jgi:hypothetical protein
VTAVTADQLTLTRKFFAEQLTAEFYPGQLTKHVLLVLIS